MKWDHHRSKSMVRGGREQEVNIKFLFFRIRSLFSLVLFALFIIETCLSLPLPFICFTVLLFFHFSSELTLLLMFSTTQLYCSARFISNFFCSKLYTTRLVIVSFSTSSSWRMNLHLNFIIIFYLKRYFLKFYLNSNCQHLFSLVKKLVIK